MASSTTIPLLRFRFLWFDVTRKGYLANSIGMFFFDMSYDSFNEQRIFACFITMGGYEAVGLHDTVFLCLQVKSFGRGVHLTPTF